MQNSLLKTLFLGPMIFLCLTGSFLQAGTLKFYANGEDLITKGFVEPKLTRDGWSLHFSHAFINLQDITAYQADPAYNPREESEISAGKEVELKGVHTVDLARGSAQDPPVFVGQAEDVQPGHYNALSWKMTPARQGLLQGYSLVLIGRAEKNGQSIDFQLTSSEERRYKCGEFVGQERKGLLQENGVADLEMTFHFDHLFGRADKAADGHMNQEALGFDFFAQKSEPVQEIDLGDIHLGHAGEGHCRLER